MAAHAATRSVTGQDITYRSSPVKKRETKTERHRRVLLAESPPEANCGQHAHPDVVSQESLGKREVLDDCAQNLRSFILMVR